MSSSARTPTDRNQLRSPNIKFRVYSQNNGDLKHEFCIKLKDITWDSFLKNLFGTHTFEENQLPTIVLLGDKHKIVLRHTNIKQLIRDALEESFKGFSVNLLIPDFENYFTPSPDSIAQNVPNSDEIKRKKAEISDFTEIFTKRVNLPTMDHFVQNAPHVRFIREERDETARVELPVRENTTQLGELQVKRLNDEDLVCLLKDGASLILQTSDNKMVSMKFYNDQLPTFNETQCKYRNLNLAYECSDLKVPVLIDDEIKFLFNRDAEFVQKMAKTIVFQDVTEKLQRDHINRLKKLQETMRKIKPGKETSPDPIAPSTSGVPAATASASAAASTAETPAPPTSCPPPQAPASTPVADTSIPPTSEGSSNEGAQTGPRVYRRPHRSAQKRTKRCLAAAALANANAISTTALANAGLLMSPDNHCRHPPSDLSRDSIVKALQDLTLSNPPPRCPGLASYYSNASAAQQSVKSGPSKTIAADARQDANPDPPAWFGDILDKFKNEVLQDVKNLVKDVLDTSLPAPSTSELKTPRESNPDDDQYHYKLLDGSPSSSAGKHKHYDKQHHGGGSSKRKSASLCSKRGGAENKTTTPYSSSEKILEISNGLFVYSKSGFKVRMPRNASLTIQINVGKFAKYRNSLEDTDLRVQSVSNSIECCVKRATPASCVGKSAPMNKDLSIYYDVRIKSKDKSGKFRLYFNVISGGRIIGHSFKIDVRVKKEFTLPFENPEGTLNHDGGVFITLREDIRNMMQAVSSSSTAAALNFAESQKSPIQNAKEELSKAVAALVDAADAAELADEGIGGNQEDFFSPTSDSEYSDVSDSKPDNLPKDEGIDTCYRSAIDTETTAAPDCANPNLDSESDTDSSISFLMDENEARDELNDSLDVVQLPSCFIPNVELTDDVLPVRIKRKSAASAKRTVPENEISDSQSQSQQQQETAKPSAFDTSTLTPVAVATSTPSPTNSLVANATATATTKTPAPTPAVTISDDEEDEDVEFLNESMKSIKSAAVEHAYHRSLYPNLHGLKECVRPTTWTVINDHAGPNPASSDSAPAQAGASVPATEPYPAILPEKLFEMWKNAVPLPKQMQDTMSSVFSSVSNEINNAANAARTAAASAAAAAANIVPNVPLPMSPTAPPAAWTMKPENLAGNGAAAASAPAQPAADTTPSTSNAENRSSHSQPPEEKRQKNVTFSFGSQPQPQQQRQNNFTFGSSQQQEQQQHQSDQGDNAEYIHSMYKNLSKEMQADLITLHEMGFRDDPYMVYLLEQFPNDLGKVIESLINYSTY